MLQRSQLEFCSAWHFEIPAIQLVNQSLVPRMPWLLPMKCFLSSQRCCFKSMITNRTCADQNICMGISQELWWKVFSPDFNWTATLTVLAVWSFLKNFSYLSVNRHFIAHRSSIRWLLAFCATSFEKPFFNLSWFMQTNLSSGQTCFWLWQSVNVSSICQLSWFFDQKLHSHCGLNHKHFDAFFGMFLI